MPFAWTSTNSERATSAPSMDKSKPSLTRLNRSVHARIKPKMPTQHNESVLNGSVCVRYTQLTAKKLYDWRSVAFEASRAGVCSRTIACDFGCSKPINITVKSTSCAETTSQARSARHLTELAWQQYAINENNGASDIVRPFCHFLGILSHTHRRCPASDDTQAEWFWLLGVLLVWMIRRRRWLLHLSL